MKKKMKIWTQSCRFSLRTRKSSKTRGNFHFFSFSLPVAPEIQESHEKQWKTLENHQKQRKMKKKWSCKWKKHENLDSKLQILTPNQEIFKNEEIFVFISFFSFQTSFFLHFKLHFFIIFFSFSLPVAPEIQESHEKQWKTMENHQKQRKMKKCSCKWKKMKIWTQSCRFSLRTRKSSKTRGNFHFFFMFLSFFFIFLARGTWNPGKPWKTMENHQKQRKMTKKWSCKWKKNENLDSKLQILTPNQEIFKNTEIFIFL